MEAIQKHLEVIQSQMEPLKWQETSKTGLSPYKQEHELIRLKYASKRIGAMSAGEIELWGQALLLKIHVITGWVIPEDDERMNILIDQFRKKLTESYPTLNTEEIEYAFRNYGTVVKDWGKAMNLSLIDEVLIPYMEERRKASEVEERKVVLKPVVYTDDQLRNFHRQWTEEWYQRIRRGQVEDVPGYSKEIMLLDGLIERMEHASAFIVDCLNKGREHLYERQ